eukprot:scaffold94848_cov65-Phaeocystis_antarctica.AAC.5
MHRAHQLGILDDHTRADRVHVPFGAREGLAVVVTAELVKHPSLGLYWCRHDGDNEPPFFPNLHLAAHLLAAVAELLECRSQLVLEEVVQRNRRHHDEEQHPLLVKSVDRPVPIHTKR